MGGLKKEDGTVHAEDVLKMLEEVYNYKIARLKIIPPTLLMKSDPVSHVMLERQSARHWKGRSVPGERPCLCQ